jgi:hypothetical protein
MSTAPIQLEARIGLAKFSGAALWLNWRKANELSIVFAAQDEPVRPIKRLSRETAA